MAGLLADISGLFIIAQDRHKYGWAQESLKRRILYLASQNLHTTNQAILANEVPCLPEGSRFNYLKGQEIYLSSPKRQDRLWGPPSLLAR